MRRCRLAGSAPDGVERYFVTDEVYTGRLTAWHADADPFEVTFWVIVSWTWQEGGWKLLDGDRRSNGLQWRDIARLCRLALARPAATGTEEIAS
jgi:hypothetical protein